jgi:hypothetical protein
MLDNYELAFSCVTISWLGVITVIAFRVLCKTIVYKYMSRMTQQIKRCQQC